MARVRKTACFTSVQLVVLSLGLSSAAAENWYRLLEIPLPPGALSLWASDISDRGEVVGMIEWATANSGFAYLGGSLTVLAAPVDHVVFGAWAVNTAGQIVGGTTSQFGIPKSALWASASDPAPLVLESGGGPDANVYATGINSAGVISGYYTGSGSGNASSWRAVKWTPDGARWRQRVLSTGVTPLPPGVFHAAYGINDAGQIVGTGSWIDPDLPSAQAAIRWEASEQPIELATLVGFDFYPRMYAYAINGNGIAVGEHVGSTGVSRAVRWTAAGAVVDLGPASGFTDTKAVDINDAGVIVGTLSAGATSAAAVHENGAWVDLNARLIGAPGWLLKSAAGINVAGQIVCRAELGGQLRAVILTPATPGDINGDGFVNDADVAVFVAVLLGDDTNPAHMAACDLNHDGGADGDDAQSLVSILTGTP